MDALRLQVGCGTTGSADFHFADDPVGKMQHMDLHRITWPLGTTACAP
jgi:hypothetical protein